jgi:hypothetical protein
MNNFDKLYSECVDYQYTHLDDDIQQQLYYCINDDFDFEETLVYGFTPFETFEKVISLVKKPKRIIIFGCSNGYQCFYFNKIYPGVPVIGIDLLDFRLQWGADKVKEYEIDNVTLLKGNFFDFQIEDGDLIWQNNLLFDIESMNDYNIFLFSNFDIQIISYVDILFDDKLLIDVNSKPIRVESINQKLETSWDLKQDFFYFYIQREENFEFDVNYILPEYRVPINKLQDYESMLISKKDIQSEKLKFLFNKNNLKKIFDSVGFNTPETYLYTKTENNFYEILKNYNTFVAKPAHRSESVDIFINSGKYKLDINKISDKLNIAIGKSDFNLFRRNKIDGGVWWKNCEKGILVEQYINVLYELKVFVVFGNPIVGDLRNGNTELYRVSFINKKNKYINWDKEYELIKKLALELKIDFFRIDFLFDGEKLWASELAVMPGTDLPEQIQDMIYKNWSRPYLKFYYPEILL